MSEIDDGGAAFPVPENTQAPEHSAYGRAGYAGMTLRDWFAGQAMAGHDLDGNWCTHNYQELADHCYRIADAMIAQRSK
jgi:hypothetical protein